MSRLLMATPTAIRNNRLNSCIYITRQLAAKTPSKPTSPPKCTMTEPPKLKHGYFPSGGTHAVFSDLPKPEGDFMTAWHAKNSKYNMVLISGILALVGTIALSISSGLPSLNATVPDYPYTEDEMEEFAREEERRQAEKEEREQRKMDILEAKELKVRRRKAKEAMAREVELMQKDIDEGVSDQEMSELVRLTQEREEFESWEKEEIKRIDEKEKERNKLKQEREKMQKENQAQRDKERKQREKA
ncbi:histone-lysine N-methyltransferase, H3 lysine-79 specific [Drosophila innubila]|uniref:histone-lysine N-methyltransferase, H3 lysine-79 specific n=1 Tax=Drosophila innubila TaxID=198719 RepID=UPI00148B6178|nr:histone-lysine N-methyltransferase, H3 lysine-79 specific [Drosophila innubila]